MVSKRDLQLVRFHTDRLLGLKVLSHNHLHGHTDFADSEAKGHQWRNREAQKTVVDMVRCSDLWWSPSWVSCCGLGRGGTGLSMIMIVVASFAARIRTGDSRCKEIRG